MTKTDIKKPSNIDLANYRYLINLPKADINLIDLIHIAVLEEEYPELIS